MTLDLFWGGDLDTARVGSLKVSCPVIEKNAPISKAMYTFSQNKKINIMVVLNEVNKAIGLVHRRSFDALRSNKLIYNVISSQPVEAVMEKRVLCVDEGIAIPSVIDLVLSRDEDVVYDPVVVERGGIYTGIVTVKDLLREITKERVIKAKYSNPLTGLPGNKFIVATVQTLLADKVDFYLFYIDLDNFKAYNDAYGIKKGDEIIRFTGSILKTIFKGQFVGHVGGDDYVAIYRDITREKAEEVAKEVIRKFENNKKGFFNSEDWKRGKLIGKGHGEVEKEFPLVTISVAVVPCPKGKFTLYDEVTTRAAEVKKKVKSMPGSSYYIDRRD